MGDEKFVRVEFILRGGKKNDFLCEFFIVHEHLQLNEKKKNFLLFVYVFKLSYYFRGMVGILYLDEEKNELKEFFEI